MILERMKSLTVNHVALLARKFKNGEAPKRGAIIDPQDETIMRSQMSEPHLPLSGTVRDSCEWMNFMVKVTEV